MGLRARWLSFLATLFVLGVGALTYQVYVIYTDVEDLENAPEAVSRAEFVDLRNALQGVRTDVAFLETKIRSIPPAFDPSAINNRLAALRSDLEFLEGQFYDYAGDFSVGVAPSTIEKPAFCFAGDVVYWDFGGGLTC